MYLLRALRAFAVILHNGSSWAASRVRGITAGSWELDAIVYCAFYLYRVSNENVERFRGIAREASEIYRRYGAIDSVTLRVTDGSAQYGCLGLCDLIRPRPEEQVFIGVDSFADAGSFKARMKEIDADHRIGQLYQEMKKVVDLSTIVRWEAEQDTLIG